MSSIILPPDSELYRACHRAATLPRITFWVGLPGAGKSLFLQQTALLAQRAGRTVHLLQYDVERLAFETAVNLQKYPEIDGFTHAAIRKGVGLWTRQGVVQWRERFPDDQHLLLGELPLVGNRLVELTQTIDDDAEPLLASGDALFLLPVPSLRIRQLIEAARDRTIAQPRHQKEEKDARPNVLRALWRDVAQAGYALGVTPTQPKDEVAYDPEVYTAVYQHLLRHRHHQTLPVDTVLTPSGSAYDLHITGTELAATPAEVNQIMTQVEQQYTPQTLEHAVANWYV